MATTELETTELGREFRFGSELAVITPGALEALPEGAAGKLMMRHLRGDWGTVCEEDRQANEEALANGRRILSAYELADGTRVWILTEAVYDDGVRACSTILLPEEY